MQMQINTPIYVDTCNKMIEVEEKHLKLESH